MAMPPRLLLVALLACWGADVVAPESEAVTWLNNVTAEATVLTQDLRRLQWDFYRNASGGVQERLLFFTTLNFVYDFVSATTLSRMYVCKPTTFVSVRAHVFVNSTVWSLSTLLTNSTQHLQPSTNDTTLNRELQLLEVISKQNVPQRLLLELQMLGEVTAATRHIPGITGKSQGVFGCSAAYGCVQRNVTMCGTSLYTSPHHPTSRSSAPDTLVPVQSLAATDADVRSSQKLLASWQAVREAVSTSHVSQTYQEFTGGIVIRDLRFKACFRADLKQPSRLNVTSEASALYRRLHAYVRRELKRIYGPHRLPVTGHLPAHFVGM
ncbi:hypothetical protein C0Q70_02790 [Pomacea canaliculata]|uniref:SEA domain-containing protein n=1 Tax=Pomacea canaliculata TaxID=400727 RepID=A0A2T7PQW5_POMCA|nr:hypothetical protein C0Q70_02790 [Pomacea canaliculata]